MPHHVRLTANTHQVLEEPGLITGHDINLEIDGRPFAARSFTLSVSAGSVVHATVEFAISNIEIENPNGGLMEATFLLEEGGVSRVVSIEEYEANAQPLRTLQTLTEP